MPWVRAYYNPAEAGGMTSPLDGTQLTVESTDSAPSGGGVVSGSLGCNTYSIGDIETILVEERIQWREIDS
jgi:hypothetical protein